MTRDQLEHAIRAASDVAGDDELWVFGSQALLGTFPDAAEPLRASIEVDLQPKNKPEMVDSIDGALGELSQFHQTHGFYVHGISLESANLPEGWQSRVIAVRDEIGTRGATGWCVDVHDLAASKLVAYREKDREFVRLLMVERMIDAAVLRTRTDLLDIEEALRERLVEWVRVISRELSGR
jgi:hypothetical protein